MALPRSHSAEALTDEKLERVFREVEEASERRAREEEADAFPSHPLVSTISNSVSNVELEKKRRRASVSISRIGNYADLGQNELQSTSSGAASPVPWAPLYAVQTRTTSTASLSSGSSFASGAHHEEEENLTTQKETIVGRRNTLTKAVSSALARTLTRMRSRGALDEVASGDEAVVIGVAVHEATTAHPAAAAAADAEGAAESDTTAAAVLAATAGGSGAAGTAVLDNTEIGIMRVSVSGTGRHPEEEIYTQVSAEPPPPSAAGATATTSTTRSRSGSINKLRGRRMPMLTLLGQTQQQPLPPTPDGARSPGHPPPPTSAKTPRIKSFARALAQRLRRRPSGEAEEGGGSSRGGVASGGGKVKKDKDKDKVKDDVDKSTLRRPAGMRRAHSASTALQLDAADRNVPSNFKSLSKSLSKSKKSKTDKDAESVPAALSLPRTSSDPSLPLIPMLPLPVPAGLASSLRARPATAPEPASARPSPSPSGRPNPNPKSTSECELGMKLKLGTAIDPAQVPLPLEPAEVPLPASPRPSLSSQVQSTDADAPGKRKNADADTRSTLSGLATQPASPALAPVAPEAHADTDVPPDVDADVDVERDVQRSAEDAVGSDPERLAAVGGDAQPPALALARTVGEDSEGLESKSGVDEAQDAPSPAGAPLKPTEVKS